MKEGEEKAETNANLSAAQKVLLQLWEEHVRHEFATHSYDRRCWAG